MYTEMPILVNPQRAELDDKQLRAFMPAAFSAEPASHVSRRYGFFPTYRVIETMYDAGYVPVEARNYLKKNPEARGHAKHMLRFRQRGNLVRGECIPEIALLNSHDRTSRFEMYAGIFRTVCENGLITATEGSEYAQPLIVQHTRNMVAGILDNVQRITRHYQRTFDIIERMKAQVMPELQQERFAVNACTNARPDSTLTIAPALLLAPRRTDDAGDTLWHVLNRVQENLVKGGLAGTSPKGRRSYTSELTGIDSSMTANKAVWNTAVRALAEEL